MRPLLVLGICGSMAFDAACHHTSSDSFLATGANNLELAPVRFLVQGNTLVVQVLEEPGEDLNGDGDSSDAVPEIIDLRTGRTTLLPLAATRFELDGGFLAFTVNELAQGIDLDDNTVLGNEDVLFVHDIASGQTTNLRFALRGGVQPYLVQEGALLAFTVSESAQGEDLDGDGLQTHDVVFTYEADLGRLSPLSVSSQLRPLLDDGRVFVAAEENGVEDKNGDGDRDDRVLFMRDTRTGAQRNFGVAVRQANGNGFPLVGVEGPLLAMAATEFGQGDLNADGDTFDDLLRVFDLDADTSLQTDVPVFDLWVGGGLVAVYAPELNFIDFTGTDYNSDGDQGDLVVFFYDGLSATLTNTEIAADIPGFVVAPVLSDRRAAFLVAEAAQGEVDQNGDGDLQDSILHLFDGRTGAVGSTALAVSKDGNVLDIDAEHVACQGSQLSPVMMPLDFQAPIGLLVDVQTGFRESLGVAVNRLSLAPGRVLVSMYEAAFFSSADLNGDGDLEDIVQGVHDLSTGETFNTGLAIRPAPFPLATAYPDVQLDGDLIGVQVWEFAQGADLNGDGDTEDNVLHVVRIP